VTPIIATYRIETALPVEQAAEMIAGEQSSGTFLPVPGETEELKARARARVTRIALRESVDRPSLPGARRPAGDSRIGWQRADVTIEFPFDNIGANLPTLVATICGNLYELAEHSGCKLLDLQLPDAFAARYPGPPLRHRRDARARRRARPADHRHDREAERRPLARADRGWSRDLGEAGIDFVKDDELMADPPHSPLARRVACVMREINRLADRTGRKVMYAVNISDEIDAMKRHHDAVLARAARA
jgi:ribulose-bisphosphate carboxylase large chain